MTTEFSCTLHSANNIYPWPRGKSFSRPDKLYCSVLPIDGPLFYRWLVVTQRVDPIRGALKYCNCLSFPFIFATTRDTLLVSPGYSQISAFFWNVY